MQTIKGNFVLKLVGIPLVLAWARLVLTSESGNRAGGNGVIIGPGLLIAWVGPKFKNKSI